MSSTEISLGANIVVEPACLLQLPTTPRIEFSSISDASLPPASNPPEIWCCIASLMDDPRSLFNSCRFFHYIIGTAWRTGPYVLEYLINFHSPFDTAKSHFLFKTVLKLPRQAVVAYKLACSKTLARGTDDLVGPLIWAACHGYQHIIEAVVNRLDELLLCSEERTWFLSTLDPKGVSALHYAARYGYDDIVQYFLQYGVSADLPDKSKEIANISLKSGMVPMFARMPPSAPHWTPLHHASLYCRPSIVKLLLQHNATVDAIDRYECTPLHVACIATGVPREAQLDTINLLLDHGADIHATEGRGLTPLHRASAQCLIHVIELLCKRGADVVHVDMVQLTALHYACTVGRFEVVKLLMQYLDPIHLPDLASDLLHCACSGGHADVAEFLLTNLDANQDFVKKGRSPLALACKMCHADVVQVLLKHGADVDQEDSQNETPLYRICGYANDDYAIIAALLLQHGAQISWPTRDKSVLHHIALHGAVKVMEVLLAERPNIEVDSLDSKGKTSLHLACIRGKVDMVKMLLEKGADPFARDVKGANAIELARKAKKHEVVALLSR